MRYSEISCPCCGEVINYDINDLEDKAIKMSLCTTYSGIVSVNCGNCLRDYDVRFEHTANWEIFGEMNKTREEVFSKSK